MQWLVEASDRVLQRLEKKASKSHVYPPRAALQMRNIPPELREKVYVFDSFKKWNENVARWYVRGLHEELTRMGIQYYLDPSATASDISAAAKQWAALSATKRELEKGLRQLKAEYRQKRGELEAAILEASDELFIATENVILTQGPMTIDILGKPYKASVSRVKDRVFLIPKATSER